MANNITGKVIWLGQVQPLTAKSGKTYYKVEFAIARNVFDRDTGDKTCDLNDTPLLRYLSENEAEVKSIAMGDEVKVAYELRGRSYDKDGVKQYITDVSVISVTRLNAAAAPAKPTDPAPSQPVQRQAVVTQQQPKTDELPF